LGENVKGKLDKKTLLLLGTGRSGTTWLGGILASPFRYRLLFEPFQPHHVEGSESVADSYFRFAEVSEKVVGFVTRAIKDEIDSDWIAQSSCRRLRIHRWRSWPRVRICKDVRTNLFVPCYQGLFSPDLPIVLLVRHPGAVIESFLRVKFPWASEIDHLLDQTSLEEDFDVPIRELRRFSGSLAGRLATRWVIENAFLLRNAEKYGIHLVAFEKLLRKPAAELESLCRELELEVPAKLEQLVSTASYTTHPKSPLRKEQDPRLAWRQRLSHADRSVLDEVLRCVQLNYEDVTCLG